MTGTAESGTTETGTTETGTADTSTTQTSTTQTGTGHLTPTRRARLRFVLILGGLTAFGPLSIDMYLPALPRMAGDLHAQASTVQLTLSAFVAGLALGQLVLGPLSDALGRRGPLLAGLALYVVGSVLCAVSPDAWLLVAARAVQSLGAAAGIVIARAAVRDLFSGVAMTKFFSTLMLVGGLAPIIAPLVGGQLLNWTSWRGVFVVLTVFGAVLLAAVAFGFPEPLPAGRRSPARLGQVMRTYGRLVRDRNFAGYALAAGLLFASMFAYISGSSFVLQGVYGLNPQVYSLVFGVNGLGIVITGQINGRLVGRVRERTLLLSGLLLGVLGGALVLTAALARLPLAVVLVALFLVVSSVGLVMPNSSSLALAEQARSAGAASALLGVLQFAVGAVATPLSGLGGPGTAVPMAATMAGFAALALVVYLTLTRDVRSATPDRPS